MNILFRTDSSSIIGTGHIMRDLVLALQYRDDNIIFATQELQGNINHKILESGYKIEKVDSNDIEEVIELIDRLSIDMIVIDSYEIDYNYEKELKEKTGVTIFVLDDTYEKHCCDILLNHNIYGNKTRYKGLVPDGCELRCGSEYTLLRDEFINEKKKEKCVEGNNKTVFLAMGGADHSNINIKILNILEYFDNLTVNVVTTEANKNLKELQKHVKNRKWIKLYVNSNKIADLMRKSSFAIVTPSVILNEVYFMGLPFIAIQTANNQSELSEYLKKRNFHILNSFDVDSLKNKIELLLNETSY